MAKTQTSLQNIKKELLELQKDLSPIVTEEIKKLWEQAMSSPERKQRLAILKQGSQKIIQDFETHLKTRSENITAHLKALLSEIRASTTHKKTRQTKPARTKKSAARKPKKKTSTRQTSKS